MFSILNRALSWAITSFGNKFCLEKRSRLIGALDNRFYVKFMQLEIGLLSVLLPQSCFVDHIGVHTSMLKSSFCLSPFFILNVFFNFAFSLWVASCPKDFGWNLLNEEHE